MPSVSGEGLQPLKVRWTPGRNSQTTIGAATIHHAEPWWVIPSIEAIVTASSSGPPTRPISGIVYMAVDLGVMNIAGAILPVRRVRQ
jgi:hypothetical protein